MSDTDSNNPIGVAPEKLASLDAAQAAAIFEQGKDAVVFALLAMAKRLSESQSPTVNPATPSGMIPVYQKPPAKKRKKKPGAKANHPGSRRVRPDRIDHHQTHRAESCLDCGGELNRCSETCLQYIGKR